MSGRRFIRIGAPAGDVGDETRADAGAKAEEQAKTQAAAGAAQVAATREEPAAAEASVRLPPEVFGAWAEDLGGAAGGPAAVKSAPAPPSPSAAARPSPAGGPGNGHGAGQGSSRTGKGPARTAGATPTAVATEPAHERTIRATSRRTTTTPRPAATGPLPMRNGRVSYEDDRLNQMRHSRRRVEVLCFGGLRLTGRVHAFDQYAIILSDGEEETVIFKHGVILLRYVD